MKLDRIWFSVFSDLWINLAAGWFGAAIIVPFSSNTTISVNLSYLTADLLFGIVSLVIAFRLRKKEKR